MNRLTAVFRRLQAENRAGLIPFLTSGDPDYATSLELLKGLPAAGADIIELGMAFTDPMADGPIIQRANLRALAAGQTLSKTLAMVEAFRESCSTTPIVLMGYYNPIYAMGVDVFLARAKAVGVDGLILVDLPAEEDRELCLPAAKAGIDFIRLVTPTTDADRLQTVMKNTRGFVYYVSITGITGAGAASEQAISAALERVRRATPLPIAVGFGIRSPEAAAAVARIADAVVVGSALIQRLADRLDDGKARADTIPETLSFVRELAQAVRRAR